MLIRVVQMHFTDTGLEEFLTLFHTHKQAIRNFEGCNRLELLKDLNDPLAYTTISHWRDRVCLENYRKSELFAAVWKNVKPLFSDRAVAFSLVQVTTV